MTPGHARTTTPVVAKLHRRRVELGWTQRRVAAAAGGIAHNTISAYENGVRVPTLDDLQRWAYALGLVVCVDVARLPYG